MNASKLASVRLPGAQQKNAEKNRPLDAVVRALLKGPALRERAGKGKNEYEIETRLKAGYDKWYYCSVAKQKGRDITTDDLLKKTERWRSRATQAEKTKILWRRFVEEAATAHLDKLQVIGHRSAAEEKKSNRSRRLFFPLLTGIGAIVLSVYGLYQVDPNLHSDAIVQAVHHQPSREHVNTPPLAAPKDPYRAAGGVPEKGAVSKGKRKPDQQNTKPPPAPTAESAPSEPGETIVPVELKAPSEGVNRSKPQPATANHADALDGRTQQTETLQPEPSSAANPTQDRPAGRDSTQTQPTPTAGGTNQEPKKNASPFEKGPKKIATDEPDPAAQSPQEKIREKISSILGNSND